MNEKEKIPFSRNNRKEWFGLVTLFSLSGGVSILLASAAYAGDRPEAVYGFVAGASLTTISVPGLLYFTREILASLDSASHH